MENQSQENKPAERTVEQIRQEYSALCAKAGHMQYQLFTIERDLELLNETLRSLNLEAASLSQKKAGEAKLAAVPSEAPAQESKANE